MERFEFDYDLPDDEQLACLTELIDLADFFFGAARSVRVMYSHTSHMNEDGSYFELSRTSVATSPREIPVSTIRLSMFTPYLPLKFIEDTSDDEAAEVEQDLAGSIQILVGTTDTNELVCSHGSGLHNIPADGFELSLSVIDFNDQPDDGFDDTHAVPRLTDQLSIDMIKTLYFGC